MNAITSLFSFVPLPTIAQIAVVDHLVVRVVWSEGIRAGRTDTVDLSPMINFLKHYRPLREDVGLFKTLHLIEDGRMLAWGVGDAIDMAADSVEALAEETMTGDDFREFLDHYDFTHQEIAAQLGRSRRQIENYLRGDELIPRIVVLACFGLIARRDIFSGSITKMSLTKIFDGNMLEVESKKTELSQKFGSSPTVTAA